MFQKRKMTGVCGFDSAALVKMTTRLCMVSADLPGSRSSRALMGQSSFMSQGEGYWANAWLCYARRTNPGQQEQLTLKLIHTLAWATAQIGGSWPVADSKLCSTTDWKVEPVFNRLAQLTRFTVSCQASRFLYEISQTCLHMHTRARLIMN